MASEQNDSEIDERTLNDALLTASAEELDGLSIQQQRLARIQEYEEEAVARSDPFAAVIGMGNAHFQRVFEHLGSALLNEFEGRTPTLEDIREHGPEIRLLVKLRSSMQLDLVLQGGDMSQQHGISPQSGAEATRRQVAG